MVQDVVRGTEKATQAVAKETERVVQDVVRETEKAAQVVAKETERVVQDVVRETEKAAQVVAKETERVVQDVVRETEKAAQVVAKETELAGKVVAKEWQDLVKETEQAVQVAEIVADQVGKVVQTAVIATCTFDNDTSYTVFIVSHDGTYTLDSGCSQDHYLVKGFFSVDLILQLSDTNEVKKNFHANDFENRTHKMSKIFAGKIPQDTKLKTPVEVHSTSSKWKLVHNHPGGFEEEVQIQMVTKNSWKETKENETEFQVNLKGLVQAIEVSASFKTKTKLTRVDEFERQLTEKRTRKFKDLCYLWQECVVIQTNQPPPYHVLEIPTPHTVQTSTKDEPGNEKVMYIEKMVTHYN